MSERRAFLKLALAGAALSSPGLRALAQARDPLGGLIMINGLGSLDAFMGNDLRGPSGRPGDTKFDPTLMKNALGSGLTAVCITTDSGTDFAAAVANVKRWDGIVADNPELLKVATTADIRRAKAEKRIGVIYGFQNAQMMEGKVENVDRFHDLGVKCVQLTYNLKNDLGGGSLAPGDPSLTDFGRQVIDRLNADKIMVDLSHSGQRICLDAARYSKRPISINHTGCRALSDTPRNKTDEELRLVAEKGGYVGIFFMNFLSIPHRYTGDDVVAHIEHAMKICGEDHVGIGSDTGVTGAPDDAKASAAYRTFMARRIAEGIAAPGENPDLLRHAADLNGPDQYRTITEKLAKRGHSARVVEKVMGQNYLRHAREIWGA